MSINQVKTKTIELYNGTDDAALKKQLAWVLREIEKSPTNKKQLIRNLEANHQFSYGSMKLIFHATIWDLKH